MKQIILIDMDCEFVESISKTNEICVLVTSEKNKELYGKDKTNVRIRNVYSYLEIINQKNLDSLSYELIEKYREVQERVEVGLRRTNYDINEIKYDYYCGLAFWICIFEKYNIEMIFSPSTNHNFVFDGIPIGIAIKNHIDVFTLEPIGYKKFYIADRDRRTCLKINSKENYIDIDDYLVDKKSDKDVMNWDFDGKYKHMGVISIVYKLFGFHMLDFLKCLKDGTLKKKTYISAPELTSTFEERHKAYKELKKIKKYLKKIGEKPILSENYVYYPLQMEPEGDNATQTFDTQLVTIAMLSQSLPEGWKLYVKEHPHQFEMNRHYTYYYLAHFDNFKNKNFYNVIKNMKNVRFIDTYFSSQELLKNSRAVAGRMSSAMFEAVRYGTPIIALEKMYPIALCSEVYTCCSCKELLDAFRQIEQQGHIEYKTIVSELSEYIFENKDKSVIDAIGL